MKMALSSFIPLVGTVAVMAITGLDLQEPPTGIYYCRPTDDSGLKFTSLNGIRLKFKLQEQDGQKVTACKWKFTIDGGQQGLRIVHIESASDMDQHFNFSHWRGGQLLDSHRLKGHPYLAIWQLKENDVIEFSGRGQNKNDSSLEDTLTFTVHFVSTMKNSASTNNASAMIVVIWFLAELVFNGFINSAYM